LRLDFLTTVIELNSCNVFVAVVIVDALIYVVLLMMLKMCSCFSNGFIISAWRRCALDIICSANTIRSYINRFGKDCNGDALVTCEDYTMIHKVRSR